MFDIPWPALYLVFLICGTALCLGMLYGIRNNHLYAISNRPLLSPNWVSVWRLPIIAAGELIYIHQGTLPQQSALWLFCGFLLVVAGLTLDRLDGKQAKSILSNLTFLPRTAALPDQYLSCHGQQEWAWFLEPSDQSGSSTGRNWRVIQITPQLQAHLPSQTFLPMFRLIKWQEANTRPSIESGAQQDDLILVQTGIGEWLDPLIDKLNYHPVFLYQAWNGQINPWVVGLMLVVDLFGTIIRAPFDRLPVFHHLQKLVCASKASAFGKIKVVGQFLTLLAAMPVIANWLTPEERQISYQVSTLILLLTLISGILSVLSRLILMEKMLAFTGLSKHFRRFNKEFEH